MCFHRSNDLLTSVADPNPDPSDPYGPPGIGSGSISQRYGSGSFYHPAKIVRKTLIPLFCDFFLPFNFEKWCKCTVKRGKIGHLLTFKSKLKIVQSIWGIFSPEKFVWIMGPLIGKPKPLVLPSGVPFFFLKPLVSDLTQGWAKIGHHPKSWNKLIIRLPMWKIGHQTKF